MRHYNDLTIYFPDEGLARMSDIDAGPVLFEVVHADNGAGIATARLNVPKSLHSLSLEMINLLHQRFTVWANDPGIAMVVLEASGEKAFCAGADLHNLHKSMVAHHASAQRDDIRANSYALDFFSQEYRLDYLIHTYPKPVMCWGHGIVMGGGVGLMSGASHRVVTESSRLAMPEITIGLFPDVGGTWLLNRAPGHSGLFLALTGAQFNAEDALFAKLADYKIANDKKSQIIAKLLRLPWSSTSEINTRLLTDTLRKFSDTHFVHGPLRENLDVIDALCNHVDLSETVSALSNLRTSNEWLTKAAATLAAGSPGSAALSAALQRRLRHCSLAETFRGELVAALRCAANPDLTEGIRALLIDKDRKPRWQPLAFTDISSDWLERFFCTPWAEGEHPLSDLGRA